MARMTLEEITAKLQAAQAAGKIWNMEHVGIKEALGRWIWEIDDHSAYELRRAVENRFERALPGGIIISNGHDLLIAVKKLRKIQGMTGIGSVKTIDAFLEFWAPYIAVAEMLVAVKPFIVKGRKPAENPSENARTIDHTGTCGCCNRNIKMNAGSQMWDHGYEIEGRGRGMHGGYGYKVGGSCFGVGYEPIEVSSKVWIDMQADLECKLVALPERIAGLAARFKALPKPVLEQPWRMTLEQRTERQAYLDLQGALGHAKLCLKLYPARIAELKVSIAEWTARPLPGTSR